MIQRRTSQEVIRDQFSASFTLVKVEVSLVPRPCTTAMMATEMPAAIRPYSIAVAPDSSATKLANHLFILSAPKSFQRVQLALQPRCDRSEPNVKLLKPTCCHVNL